MAKVIYIDDNGNETVLREGWFGANNVLFRDDYIATKLWCTEDIAMMMEDMGYKVTPERVADVENSCGWEGLSDCTDEDWMCIQYQIEDVLGEPDAEEKEAV